MVPASGGGAMMIPFADTVEDAGPRRTATVNIADNSNGPTWFLLHITHLADSSQAE